VAGAVIAIIAALIIMSGATGYLQIHLLTGKSEHNESINRKKNNQVAAYCTEHSHSWVYLRAAGHHASTGHGGKMDHYAIAGDLRILVMERAFAS
jgi:hypothetical protein